MKDLRNLSMLFLSLLIGSATLLTVAGTFASCGGKDDPETVDTVIIKDCYTEPSKILLMSNGVAFNWNFGSDTKYFHWTFFSQEDYNSMSESEIIATLKEQDAYEPDHDDFACIYSTSPDVTISNLSLVVVTLSYSSDNQQGELVVTPMTTKSDVDQPEATIDEVVYDKDKNGNDVYRCKITKNNFCKLYYTYIAACPDIFLSYYIMAQGYTPMLAWLLRNEKDKDGQGHSTTINVREAFGENWKFRNGRDKFFTAQLNDGYSYFTADKKNDKYVMFVTWATGNNDELSGIFGYKLYNLSQSSSSRKTMGRIPLSASKEEGKIQKIMMKQSDFKLSRLD